MQGVVGQQTSGCSRPAAQANRRECQRGSLFPKVGGHAGPKLLRGEGKIVLRQETPQPGSRTLDRGGCLDIARFQNGEQRVRLDRQGFGLVRPDLAVVQFNFQRLIAHKATLFIPRFDASPLLNVEAASRRLEAGRLCSPAESFRSSAH